MAREMVRKKKMAGGEKLLRLSKVYYVDTQVLSSCNKVYINLEEPQVTQPTPD
jgi:hypothetical protein